MARTYSYIGRSNWSQDAYFDGQIKSLNIWERALSATEISDLYNLGRNYSVVPYTWVLVTTLQPDDDMNNPWTGEGEPDAPSTLTLEGLSDTSGTDLEIKLEWDNTDGSTSTRYYKGWYLDEIFDYKHAHGGTATNCSARFTEEQEWFTNNQGCGSSSSGSWQWSFSSQHLVVLTMIKHLINYLV